MAAVPTCSQTASKPTTARRLCAVFTATALVLVSAPDASSSGAGPSPPCGSGSRTDPPFASPGAAPTVALWRDVTLTPIPDCPESLSGRFRRVLALASTTEETTSIDALAARMGAISTLRGLKYWSVTDRGWRALFNDAYAVRGSDDSAPRADFSVSEVLSGETLYFVQDDTRSSGRTLYALKAHRHSADSVTFETYNVTAINLLLLRLFDAGSLRSFHFFRRSNDQGWFYYGLSLAQQGIRRGSERSFINRAAAYYRHLNGIPSDRNPPLAR